MRARSIKPGICDNEVLGTADPFITLLFERLWMMADRDGRLEDRPLRIKAQAFPYRDGLDVEPMLSFLTEHGFILRYTADGNRYIQVSKFSEHQSPHIKESASKIPAPVEHCASTGTAPCKEQPKPAPAALTPSSLTPDSGLSDSGSFHSQDARVSESEHHKGFQSLKTSYPKFAGRQDWMQAEMYCRNRIDDGETWMTLKAAVERFAGYCRATGREGSNFVMSPGKFFSAADEPWKQPWDPPTERQKPSQSQGAFARIMAANGGSHDD